MLLQYLGSVLVSEVWTVDDIMDEISEVKGKILACAAEAIKTISFSVYPAIDGHDKQRLAYIYSLLSDCYLQLEETKEFLPVIDPNSAHVRSLGLAHFYKIIEQECTRVTFIKGLNFKNIAGLQGLNHECFSSEVYAHIDEYSVEALAKMVQTLVGIYGDPLPEGLVSWQYVYKHHVLSLLMTLENRAKTEAQFQSPENLHCFISELERTYSTCRSYIIAVAYPDFLHIMKRLFTGILPLNYSFDRLSCNSTWQDCLIVLLSFWLRLAEDMLEFKSDESSEEKFSPKCLMSILKAFVSLVMAREVSPSQGWGTVIGYVKYGLTGGVSVEIFIYCRAMVFSGCRFKAVADVFSEVVSQFLPGSTLVDDTEGYFDNILDLSHLYSSILESVLQDLVSGILEHQNLHRLLSSLSKVEGDLEDLKRVRHTVWARMTKFSDNLQLPSHARVYVLEVMQFIATTGRNSKAVSAELEANVLPWEGWDNLESTSGNKKTSDDHEVPNATDASSRFETTLVALKSSQLASVISPTIEVSAADLLTVESAVSCFLELCGAAILEPHLDALLAIMGEWEGLFTSGRDEAASPAEASDAGNNWSNDDWDEGWESFQEEPLEKEEPKKNNTSSSVHPLHVCWVQMFKKLVLHSRSRDVIKLIDQSIPKKTGILADEDGARSLSQSVLDVDCFAALKIALLMPYEAIRLQCLDVVEDNLKQGGMPEMDYEFLVLILSSGIISTIVTNSCYGSILSYLCHIVGNFCRKSQEAQLLSLKQRGTNENANNEQGILLHFQRRIFPSFISELVKADQQILAGVLVTKFMHTNASLSLLSVAEASLRRYLEMQLQVLQGEEFTSEDKNFCEPLVNTISSLRGRLGHLFQSALSSLSTSVRR